MESYDISIESAQHMLNNTSNQAFQCLKFLQKEIHSFYATYENAASLFTSSLRSPFKLVKVLWHEISSGANALPNMFYYRNPPVF